MNSTGSFHNTGAFRQTANFCFAILFSAVALTVFSLHGRPRSQFFLLIAMFAAELRFWLYYTYYLGNPDYPEDFIGDIFNLCLGQCSLVAIRCVSEWPTGLFFCVCLVYFVDFFWCRHEIKRLDSKVVPVSSDKLANYYRDLFVRWRGHSWKLGFVAFGIGVVYHLWYNSSRLDFRVGELQVTTRGIMNLVVSIAMVVTSSQRFRKIGDDLAKKQQALKADTLVPRST